MNKIKTEKLFLILSLVFGFIMTFVTPPLQAPDEDTHFIKAYMMSTFDFYPEYDNNIIGQNVPNSISEFRNDMLSKMGDYDFSYSYKDLYYLSYLKNDVTNTNFISYSTVSTNIVGHFIPSVGVWFTKLITGTLGKSYVYIYDILIGARIFSLVVYSLICYFAIKRVPILKKSFFVILLLPMSLFLRSVISYDALILACVAFMLSDIISLLVNKRRFNKFDLISLSIGLFVLLNIKLVYSIFIIPLCFVSSNKFKYSKDKWIKIIMVFSFAIMLSILTSILNFTPAFSNNSPEQISYIIHNPMKYLLIIFKNIFSGWNTQKTWMIGTFGLLDAYLPYFVIEICFINMLLVFILDGITTKKLNGLLKIFMILCGIGATIGIYTAMYISWTPYVLNVIGGTEITGVQGRYFLPLLFILPLLFTFDLNIKNPKIKKCITKFLDFYWVIPLLTLCVSIFVIFIRFWI